MFYSDPLSPGIFNTKVVLCSDESWKPIAKWWPLKSFYGEISNKIISYVSYSGSDNNSDDDTFDKKKSQLVVQS